MSETAPVFKTMTIPQLSDANFADEFNDFCTAVRDNFNRMLSLPFLKGDKGAHVTVEDMYVYDPISGDLTLLGAYLFYAITGTSPSVPSATGSAFISETEGHIAQYYGDINTTYGASAVDGGPVDGVYALSELFIDPNTNSNLENTALRVIFDSQSGDRYLALPYFFFDARVKTLSAVTAETNANIESFRDLSTAITGIYTPLNNRWALDARQYIPTLYYDVNGSGKGVHAFCWCVNGDRSQVIAQGVKGDNGRAPQLLIGEGHIDDALLIVDELLSPAGGNAVQVGSASFRSTYEGDIILVYYPEEYNQTDTVLRAQLGQLKFTSPGDTPYIDYISNYNLLPDYSALALRTMLYEIGPDANPQVQSLSLRGLFIPANTTGDNHMLYDDNGTLVLSPQKEPDLDANATMSGARSNINFNIRYKNTTTKNLNVTGNATVNNTMTASGAVVHNIAILQGDVIIDGTSASLVSGTLVPCALVKMTPVYCVHYNDWETFIQGLNYIKEIDGVKYNSHIKCELTLGLVKNSQLSYISNNITSVTPDVSAAGHSGIYLANGDVDIYRAQKTCFDVYLEYQRNGVGALELINNIAIEYDNSFRFIKSYNINSVQTTELINSTYNEPLFTIYVNDKQCNLRNKIVQNNTVKENITTTVYDISTYNGSYHDIKWKRWRPLIDLTIRKNTGAEYHIGIPVNTLCSMGLRHVPFNMFYGYQATDEFDYSSPLNFAPVYYFQPLTTESYIDNTIDDNPDTKPAPSYPTEPLSSLKLCHDTNNSYAIYNTNTTDCSTLSGISEQICISYYPGFDYSKSPTRMLGDVRVYPEGFNAYNTIGGAQYNGSSIHTNYEEQVTELPDQH